MYVLRITENKFTVIEQSSNWKAQLSSAALRRCLPVIRHIVSRVCDDNGVPLELHKKISGQRITFRSNLQLDTEAGAKLMLLFKLAQRVRDIDRIELMAWRIARFTGEEASYWLTRITCYQRPMSDWAIAGLRTLLAGEKTTEETLTVLETLRMSMKAV